MTSREIHMVTGAFGFSGKYIAGRLLDAGHEVRTLTNSPDRENPFEGQVKAYPYNFDDPEKLVQSLTDVSVLYNNYWVRFNYKDFSYNHAVENSLKLFDAAKMPGSRGSSTSASPTRLKTLLSNISAGRQNWRRH